MSHTKLELQFLNECKSECEKYITFEKIKEIYEQSKEKQQHGTIDDKSLKDFVLPLAKKSIKECYNKLRYYVGKDYKYSLLYLNSKVDKKIDGQLQQLILDIAKNITLFYYTLIKNEFEEQNGDKEIKQNE